jgi:hypothetical protein
MKKVIHASFHSNSNYIPGVGDVGRTLPAANKTLTGLEMSVSQIGLLASYAFNGIKHVTLFPLAAVAFMSLDPKDEK